MDIGIVGGSGYAGAELLRLCAAHPVFKVRTVAGASAAGRGLAEVFPHLSGHVGLPDDIVPVEIDGLAACDVVFLATPHEVSLELAPRLMAEDVLVVDLSAAFRLTPELFSRYYGAVHTAADLTPAAYGLPELFRARLPGARLVAVPGCYPTAALLALAPLAGLVDPMAVVIAGMSGTSGAGKALRDDLHASHAIGNVAPYASPGHRHTPEIEAGWSALTGSADPAAVTFTPHLLPMPRGLLCTVVAPAMAPVPDIRAHLVARYADEPCVTVSVQGTWPQTAHVVGSNAAHVTAAYDERTGNVTAACAIDNLTKGAAGQAIQAANVVLGLPELAGLPLAGVYP